MSPAHVEAGENLKTVVVSNEAVEELEATNIDSECVVLRSAYQKQI